MYDFKLEQFEGPLNLLLQLIEQDELNISEISLAKIADQYIEYIDAHTKDNSTGGINADELSDFLVIAAKLLLIKSKYLMPFLMVEDEEEIGDLEQRLKIYKEFLDASGDINDLYNNKLISFLRNISIEQLLKDGLFKPSPRPCGRGKQDGKGLFFPPATIEINDLGRVFEEIIKKLAPKPELEEEKMNKTVSVQEKFNELRNLINQKVNFKFSNLFNEDKDKGNIIVSFLAVLELVKQKVVFVEQENYFEDIYINCYVED